MSINTSEILSRNNSGNTYTQETDVNRNRPKSANIYAELASYPKDSTGMSANYLLMIQDYETGGDLFVFCSPNGVCTNVSAEQALSTSNPVIAITFSKECYIESFAQGQINNLMAQRDVFARQFSKQDVQGRPIDIPNYNYTNEALTLHCSTEIIRASSTSPIDPYNINIYVGNSELVINGENLPNDVSNHYMIKTDVYSTTGGNHELAYLDLENNNIYSTTYYKGSPSWTTLTPSSDSNYIQALNNIYKHLITAYQGNEGGDGKIEAYEPSQYVKSILKGLPF